MFWIVWRGKIFILTSSDQSDKISQNENVQTRLFDEGLVFIIISVNIRVPYDVLI